MWVIYKATLAMQDEQFINLPSPIKILSTQLQHDSICVWFLCEPGSQKKHHKFRIYGTGHPIENNANLNNFIGTVQSGSLVWHIFYEGEL